MGTHLIVLGGLFTLNKGRWDASGLGAVVPVETSDPWRSVDLSPSEIFPGGGIRHVHDLRTRDGSRILQSISGHPVWVTWPRGRGRVTVFLGMPCGRGTGTMFWDHRERWAEHAAAMIKMAEGDRDQR